MTSTGTINFTDDYEYFGLRSNNGAIYLSSVEITWAVGEVTPPAKTYEVVWDFDNGEDDISETYEENAIPSFDGTPDTTPDTTDPQDNPYPYDPYEGIIG